MTTASSRPAPRYRAMRFGITRALLRDGADGVRYLRGDSVLESHAHRMTDRLVHWAQAAPERTFVARRVKNADGSSGDWRHLTYREALDGARRIGQAPSTAGLAWSVRLPS